MYGRIILFLIKRKLKIKENDRFKFKNQKKPGIYWFTKSGLIKKEGDIEVFSDVSLNWLINDECKIVRI